MNLVTIKNELYSISGKTKEWSPVVHLYMTKYLEFVVAFQNTSASPITSPEFECKLSEYNLSVNSGSVDVVEDRVANILWNTYQPRVNALLCQKFINLACVA